MLEAAVPGSGGRGYEGGDSVTELAASWQLPGSNRC